MRKYILSFILILTFSVGAKAQLSVGYSVGYGSYDMDEMKRLLGSMKLALSGQFSDLPFAVADNFPGHVTHSLDLAYRIKAHEIGLRGTYLTTGGNVAYSDYTGKYSAKLTVNGYRLGLNYRVYVPTVEVGSGMLSFYAELSPGVMFTNLKSEEYMRIFDQTQYADEELDATATVFTILPQVGFKWDVLPSLGIHIGAGYDIQVTNSNFEYRGLRSNVKPEWSGIRINGGISYTFGR